MSFGTIDKPGGIVPQTLMVFNTSYFSMQVHEYYGCILVHLSFTLATEGVFGFLLEIKKECILDTLLPLVFAILIKSDEF